jgi:hypothetical protein
LLDRLQPSIGMHAARLQLDQALGTTLGRSTIDVITTMPGWLLEANAVLHPRWSENDPQYEIDGMPIYSMADSKPPPTASAEPRRCQGGWMSSGR